MSQGVECYSCLPKTAWPPTSLLRRFENDGSFPYDLNRARVRADFEFSKLVGIVGEWDLDDYTEKDRSYGSGADFKAKSRIVAMSFCEPRS